MARESYFVLDCSLYSNSIAKIILAFNQIGWGYSDNQKEFLPLHDDDDFNWESQPLSVNELLSIISNKQECGELCGVILYHQNSDKGISILAKNTKEIQVNININRKIVCNEFTDASWYIKNIIAKLEDIGCIIQSVSYQEIIG